MRQSYRDIKGVKFNTGKEENSTISWSDINPQENH